MYLDRVLSSPKSLTNAILLLYHALSSPLPCPGAALASSSFFPLTAPEKDIGMLKRATVLLLVVLLSSYAAPVSAQTSTEEELTAQFAAEFNEYAATHSLEELKAYAQYRLDLMTSQSLIPEQSTESTLGISPQVWYGPDYGDMTSAIYYDLDREPYDSPYAQCLRMKREECRVEYNAKLFESAAIATAVFAGCTAITSGAGFALCAAAALAMHAMNITAARQRYQWCLDSAPYNCRRT